MTTEECKNDALLVAALKIDSHEAFVKIFHRYYADLVRFTARFIPDKSTCEDIVQEAFIKLWTNRKKTGNRYLHQLLSDIACPESRS